MRAECRAEASLYRLALPAGLLSGRAGSRLGRGTGSSLEFQDFRDYIPGDDLRHVDWRSFARTDQLKVRLFREEVSPNMEIVADLSSSMGVTEAKERAFRDLLEGFAEWGLRCGSRPRRLACGGGPFEADEEIALRGDSSGVLRPETPLRPRSLRVLISDFLFPGDPTGEIRKVAAGAAHLYVIQLLDPWEMSPEEKGSETLVDCEDERRLDLTLDAKTVQAYRKRFSRLRESVERAARGLGGQYACVPAAKPAAMFRNSLLPQGILEPA